MAPLPGLRLLLGYRNYYAIHGSPYTSAHVLIENTFTLVQHKMAKNFRMALCCQNRGTGRHYGRLHYGARLTEEGGGEERISTKQRFSRFQVSYLKHSTSSYKWLQ